MSETLFTMMTTNDGAIDMQMDPITAVCIIGNIQLATRHRENLGPSRDVAEAFARQLQANVTDIRPDLALAMQMGWDPDFDFDATSYGDQFKRRHQGRDDVPPNHPNRF